MHIHLLGPSGSGTSTLGKYISEKYDLPWIDADDIFWLKTNPPFTDIRDKNDRIELLKTTLYGKLSWVLSGSVLGWGDFLKPEFDVVIYKYVNQEERLKRLKIREKERYGNRIEKGNDMYQKHIEFINWSMSYDDGDLKIRSKMSHNEWMKDLNCKIIKIEENISIDEELKIVDEYLKKEHRTIAST